MQKSKAYENLLKQISVEGASKLDGYSIDTLENIYDGEREEIENLIWNTFYDKKDVNIAVFFPKLRTYNGIQALKDVVSEYIVPSSASMFIAFLIYNNTRESIYLKLMKRNIEESHYDYSYVSMLIYTLPSEDVYQVLADIYKNCSEKIACGSAINGILYNKGFIKDINNINDIQSMKELRMIFKNATGKQKDELLKKLELGEFEYYKNV